MRRQANLIRGIGQWQLGRSSGPSFEREVHLEPWLGGRAIVHETQVKPGCDLPDFVPIISVDSRCLTVVKYQRRLAVKPALTLIDLTPNHPNPEETIDGGGLTVLEHLSLPQKPCTARQYAFSPGSWRQERRASDPPLGTAAIP